MKVVWTEHGLADLDRIQQHIALNSPAAAFRLAQSIYNRTKTVVEEQPYAGRLGRVDETRELVLSKTPYIVVYRVRANIEIVAVLHSFREWPKSFS
jgi:toxin ParE1/3/4